MPIRLDRLEAGVTAWLRAALPTATVLWAPSEYPRPAAGSLIVTAKILAGPDDDPRGGTSKSHVRLPTAATFRVLSAPVGASFYVRVSGRQWGYTIPADATIETVRDAVLALILDEDGVGPLVSASFVAVDTDEIAIAGDAVGDLYRLSVECPTAGVVEMEATAEQLCEVAAGDVTALLEVQAYSAERAPRLGATAAIAALKANVRLRDTAEVLDTYGLSIVGAPGRIVPLDALAGPTWQSRAAWRPTLATLQLAAQAIGPIESLRATLELRRSGAPTVTVNVEADLPP